VFIILVQSRWLNPKYLTSEHSVLAFPPIPLRLTIERVTHPANAAVFLFALPTAKLSGKSWSLEPEALRLQLSLSMPRRRKEGVGEKLHSFLNSA
jgi:hypothetical protein